METIRKTNKRTKTLGLHEWTKNDTILCLYYTKYGTNGLFLNSESAVANFIDTSVGSLKMQSANFRELMGLRQDSLSDYSKLQAEVYDEYNGMGQFEFRKVVKGIIGQDEFERNELLKKLGKDPSKMKMV